MENQEKKSFYAKGHAVEEPVRSVGDTVTLQSFYQCVLHPH